MAEAGETILIVRHGRVVARMGPPSAWPDGVGEAPVREMDLDALERDGLIRKPKKPLDLAELDAIPMPEPDPSLPSLLDVLLEERRKSW